MPPSFTKSPSALSVVAVPSGAMTWTADPNEGTPSTHGPGVLVAVGCRGVGVAVGVGAVADGVGPVAVGVVVTVGVRQVMPASATSRLPLVSRPIYTGFTRSPPAASS
jgi:hypothetical protein